MYISVRTRFIFGKSEHILVFIYIGEGFLIIFYCLFAFTNCGWDDMKVNAAWCNQKSEKSRHEPVWMLKNLKLLQSEREGLWIFVFVFFVSAFKKKRNAWKFSFTLDEPDWKDISFVLHAIY